MAPIEHFKKFWKKKMEILKFITLKKLFFIFFISVVFDADSESDVRFLLLPLFLKYKNNVFYGLSNTLFLYLENFAIVQKISRL